MNKIFTEQRLCFAPKGYDFGADYESFLTCAFRQGKVLTLREFEIEWNLDSSRFSDLQMRVLNIYPTCWEMCPNCENEIELETKWDVGVCPICGKAVIPCNLCSPYYDDCSNCPLEALKAEVEKSNYVIVESNGEALRFDNGHLVVYGSIEDAEVDLHDGDRILSLEEFDYNVNNNDEL